jgi:hypothetical protein
MINQCDGCRAGMPLDTVEFGNKLHRGEKLWDLMICQAHRYTDKFEETFKNDFERSLRICREMQERREH